MKDNKFINLLEDIHNKVEELRLSGTLKLKDGYGKTLISGDVSEFLNQRRGLDFYFFVYLWYTGVLNDDIPADKMDVTILLNISESEKKKKILTLWESINSNLHHSFPEWMQVIGQYHLNQYRSEENDIQLVKWINNNYLYLRYLGQGVPSTRLLLNIIERTASVMGINANKKRVLIIGDEEQVYKDLFTGQIKYIRCTLCPENEYYYNCALLNSLLLGEDTIQVLKRDKDSGTIFPFELAKFDTIYSFIGKYDNNKILFIDKVIKFLDTNGIGFVFYQPHNICSGNKWNGDYDYPLIASSNNGTLYICKNSNLQNKVRSLVIRSSKEEIEVGSDTIIEYFSNLINKGAIADDYQELTKEDFLYASPDKFLNELFRQPDQMTFIFRPISDIISYPEYNYDVPAKDISNNLIIENETLSDNPFNVTLSPSFYLEPDVVDDSYSKIIRDKVFCIEENPKWSEILEPFFIDNHFLSLAEILAIKDSTSVIPSHDRNLLECRIIRKPVILWDENKRFCKVKASDNTPVCYRQCFFFILDYGLLGCNYRMREIIISSEYDEDFIIYQICNKKHEDFIGTHILVAPSKEEQKAYYLKKREEYRMKNADLVNEIRNEERRKISIDLHYLKHDAAQYLSTLESAKSLFEGRLENGSLNLTDIFRSGHSVKDYLEDIGKCVSHVTSFLEQMTFLTDVLPQRPMDICQLLQDLVANTLTTKEYDIELELSESINDVKCLLDERIHKAFDNILSNAERHAFIDKKRKDYKVRINGVKDGDVVIVTFSNNGVSPDPTLTEEGFFTRGLHVGPTGNSGFGGSIIRETIEAQNGIVHLHLNENTEYPFQIEIKLPVYYD